MRRLIVLSLLPLALGLWTCSGPEVEDPNPRDEAPKVEESQPTTEAAEEPSGDKEIIQTMDFESGTLEEADAVQSGESEPAESDDSQTH